MDNGEHDSTSLASKFSHPIWWLWAALVVAGGYDLWTRHEAHLLQTLPYLVLLACPLMHLFMHRGHGHGHHQQGGEMPSGGTRKG